MKITKDENVFRATHRSVKLTVFYIIFIAGSIFGLLAGKSFRTGDPFYGYLQLFILVLMILGLLMQERKTVTIENSTVRISRTSQLLITQRTIPIQEVETIRFRESSMSGRSEIHLLRSKEKPVILFESVAFRLWGGIPASRDLKSDVLENTAKEISGYLHVPCRVEYLNHWKSTNGKTYTIDPERRS